MTETKFKIEDQTLEKIIRDDCDNLTAQVIIGHIQMLERQIRAFGAVPWSRRGD